MLYHYVYDGSLEGLFSVFCTIKEENKPPYTIEKDLNSPTLLGCEIVVVSTNEKKARQVARIIRGDWGETAYENFDIVNRSCHPLAPLWLYQYSQLGKIYKANLANNLRDPVVVKINQLRRRVMGERHRLLGLARFRLLSSGIYYSRLTPDNDILPLLAPHFASRLADQRFIIHDDRRNMAIFAQNGKWKLTDWQEDYELMILGMDDDGIEEIWRGYFNNISIRERENRRQQANYMPRRYWDNLVERPGESKTKARDISLNNTINLD